VNERDNIALAEIVTWNDYGESHYLGPIEGAQPNSQAWVDGLNHTGWLDMTSYYATAFKTGAYPAITQDKLYMWARTHPAQANAPDPVGKPSNFALTQDTLWAVVMMSAPGTVTLDTSADGSGAKSFNVPAGVSKLSVPLTVGGGMHGTIQRGGQTVVDVKPDGYTFEQNIQTYNYNAFVAFNGQD
jgi:glucan endo-1,3-alpha-glucosidase